MVLQVPDNVSGSLVYQIDPLSSAASVLQVHDVVTEVDGESSANHHTPLQLPFRLRDACTSQQPGEATRLC